KKIVSVICAGLFLASCATTSPQKANTTSSQEVITTSEQTVTATSSQGFNLEGQIEGLQADVVNLRYRADDGIIQDSSKVGQGRFSFSGNVVDQTQAHLSTKDRSLSAVVYLENAEMKVTGEGTDLTVTGSVTHND